MIRLFVPDALDSGGEVAPSADQARYLTTVMRQGVGDVVSLFNGRDGEWRAVVTLVSKKGCGLRVEARTRAQAFTPDLDLIIALVKRPRLEIIVEKAVELGVRRIRPALTARTNAGHCNVARLQAIAVEAAEQTGRLDVPQVMAPEKLERITQAWEQGRSLVYCDEAGDDPAAPWGGEAGRARPMLQALSSGAAAIHAPWAILIGPEGGFSPQERLGLRGLAFVTPVTLGPRILRADTAAISALTLWQAALGDWAPSP